MSAMKRLFQVMADKKASDIFLSVGAPINIKINGIAVPVNQTTMTTETVEQLLYEVLNERQIREFEEEMELNTAYNLAGVGTFRISAFRQKGSPSVVVRYIPASIPPIDTRGLMATPPLGLLFFRAAEAGDDYGALMAATVIVTLPLVAAFLAAQRRFIEGITLTGLKG